MSGAPIQDGTPMRLVQPPLVRIPGCPHHRLEVLKRNISGITDDPVTPIGGGLPAMSVVVPVPGFYKCLDCGVIQSVVLQMTIDADIVRVLSDYYDMAKVDAVGK